MIDRIADKRRHITDKRLSILMEDVSINDRLVEDFDR